MTTIDDYLMTPEERRRMEEENRARIYGGAPPAAPPDPGFDFSGMTPEELDALAVVEDEPAAVELPAIDLTTPEGERRLAERGAAPAPSAPQDAVGLDSATVVGSRPTQNAPEAALEADMARAAPRPMADVLEESGGPIEMPLTDPEWQRMLATEQGRMEGGPAAMPSWAQYDEQLAAALDEADRDAASARTELERAQAQDRRRRIFGALVQALAGAGMGIAAARGRYDLMPLLGAVGTGVGSTLGASADREAGVRARQAGDAAAQEREREIRSADIQQRRVGMEGERLGLAREQGEREGQIAEAQLDLARSKAEREGRETAVELDLHDPESETSRVEQDATIASLSELRQQAGAPPLTEDEQARVRRMAAASLRDPRGAVARAFGVSEEALKTRRAEIMASGEATRFHRQEMSRIRAEERAEGRRHAERVREAGGVPLDVDRAALEDYRAKQMGIAMGRHAIEGGGETEGAQQILARYPDGDVPGVGGPLGMLDDERLSGLRAVLEPIYGEQYMADAVALRRIANATREAAAIATAGTSFTQAQVEALKASIGLKTAQDPADFRRDLEHALEYLSQRGDEADRAAPPAVIDYFRTQGARTGRFGGGGSARAPEQPERGGRETTAPRGGRRAGWVYDPESGAEQHVSDIDEARRRMPRLREGRAP